ncbi:hypothetical protein V8E54_001653 [Elaphomyces granulatus]
MSTQRPPHLGRAPAPLYPRGLGTLLRSRDRYVKLIHQKGKDRNKPRTVFYFAVDMLIFCPITVAVSLAIRDKALDTRTHGLLYIFEVRNREPADKPFPFANLRDSRERQTLDAGMEARGQEPSGGGPPMRQTARCCLRPDHAVPQPFSRIRYLEYGLRAADPRQADQDAHAREPHARRATQNMVPDEGHDDEEEIRKIIPERAQLAEIPCERPQGLGMEEISHPAAHLGCRPDDGAVRKARDSEASPYLAASDKPTDKVYTFRPIAGVEVTEVLQSGGGDGLGYWVDVTIKNNLKIAVKAFLSWFDGAAGQALTSPTIDVQPGKTEGPYPIHFSASSKDFTLTAAPL